MSNFTAKKINVEQDYEAPRLFEITLSVGIVRGDEENIESARLISKEDFEQDDFSEEKIERH